MANTSTAPIRFDSSNATEYLTSLYQDLFHHSADSAGLTYWTDQLQNHAVTYVQVLQDFINSPEFTTTHSSTGQFVTELYTAILGRTPDASGLAFWTDALQNKSLTANQIVQNFVASSEFSSSQTNQAAASLPGHILLSAEGGGFRAFTAASGMLAGLLDHYQKTQGSSLSLGHMLSNVTALSGNSGGTWFESALAYSPGFDTSLHDFSNFFNASQGGYMGQVKQALSDYLTKPSNYVNFTSAQNQVLGDLLGSASGDDNSGGLSALSLLADATNLNWQDILINSIFAPDNTAQLLQNANFHSSTSARTSAVPNQSLIFETAVSTNQAGIADYNAFNETISTVTNAGVDSSGQLYKYIPSASTSLGHASDVAAPALPTISGSTLNVSYGTTTALLSKSGTSTSVTLPNLNFDGMSALSATAASSAAAAFTDSVSTLSSNPVLNLLPNAVVNNFVQLAQETATPVSIVTTNGVSTASNLPNSAGLNYAEVPPTTPQQLQSNPILRIADGGYVDNTGVTGGLTYLQANNQLSNFIVTAIDTYQPLPANAPDAGLAAINPNYNNLDQGARNLFTNSNQSQTVASMSVSHPSVAVFDSKLTTGLDNPVWKYTNPTDGFSIALYQLGVTTTANNLGIASGVHGTLNVWEIYSGAATATLPALWGQYQNLYDDIVGALQQTNNGHVGATLLSQTIGLV